MTNVAAAVSFLVLFVAVVAGDQVLHADDEETFESVFGFEEFEDFTAEAAVVGDYPGNLTFSSVARCWTCKAVAKLMMLYHATGANPRNLMKIASRICRLFRIEAGPVCHGMVFNVGTDIFAILDLDRDREVTAADICGMALGGTCQLGSRRINGWKLDIPDLVRPPPTKPPVWPDDNAFPKQKILHLSDVHLQLDYKVGSNAICRMPVCCAGESGGVRGGEFRPASSVGEYSCDLPFHTFDRILEEVSRNHEDVDYVFLTGDFPAHDSWKQNRSGNLESARKVVELIGRHFPSTAVFPAVGNHESFPVNMFPDPATPGRFAPKWLYQKLADFYKRWLPDRQQQATLRDAGFYSVLLRNGLRVISINTNFCNNFNFWLLLDFSDPHKHLDWLYRHLHKSEVLKEKVYILGHIPPGSGSCLGKWSEEYGRIVSRFRNTIAGQFYGHTHADEFELFFENDDRRAPINIAYVAPSQTPIEGVNPSYRIYTIDGAREGTTNLVLDHHTYWMNLTEAQRTGRINFELEYAARSDLGLDNLSPEQWHSYVRRLARDDRQFQAYRERYSRHGISRPCDTSCRKQMLCDLVTADSMDRLGEKSDECRSVEDLVDASEKRAAITYKLWNYLFVVPSS